MSSYEELIERQRAEVFSGFLGGVRRLLWPAERLAAEREKRLRALLTWSVAESPFWRERLAGHDLASFTEAQLTELPILTKSDLMRNFDQCVTDPALTLERVNEHVDRLDKDAYLDDQYRVIATSGSGGTRTLFVYGWEDWKTFVILATRWRGRSGPDPEAPVGSLFASNAKHVSGALHAFSRDFSGEGTLPVAHLPATLPLPEIVAGLNAARPTALQGYPSAVHLLARESRAGRLHLRPKWVMTCGEQCTSEIRDAVRSAWGVEIYDTWGCSEGIYAFPCEVGRGMHLPDDLTIVEPVDHQGNRVPYGQPADKILLTNLYNMTQPLVRYEVTDAMTVVDEPCECGCAHRRIDDIRGRTDSVFFYAGGAAVHWLGMTSVLLSDPAVVEMQVSQTPGGADVSLVASGSCDTDRLRAGMVELFSRSGVAQPEVNVRLVASLDRLWSGKVRQFQPLSSPAA